MALYRATTNLRERIGERVDFCCVVFPADPRGTLDAFHLMREAQRCWHATLRMEERVDDA